MKRNNALARCTAIILFLLVSISVLSGCEMGAISGAEIDNPKKSIVEFIDAMQAAEFDDTAAQTAMGYIANYSTMGFEKYSQIQGDALEKKLFDILRKSYKAEFYDSNLDPVSSPYQSSDVTISGKKATVKLKFVSVDYTLISQKLSSEVAVVGADRMYYGETYETEADALRLAQEVFDSIFTPNMNMSEFCVDRELTLDMEYIDGRWKIVVNDELYDALLGR